MRRSLAALAAAAAMLAGFAPAPAWAAPTGCTGVWVVVDATALGGEVTTACAAAHATGAEALASAGFEVARNSGMICQIASLPERCTVATTAYWSYWQATAQDAGYAEWTYTMLGPDSTRPQGGAAEGWVFGDGSVAPSVLPPEPAQPATQAVPPASASPAVPTQPGSSAGGGSGPAGIAVVGGGLLVAGAAVWLARRRRAA